MSREELNNGTKGQKITVKLIERDEWNGKSIWEVSNVDQIDFVYGGHAKSLPAGSRFEYTDALDTTTEEVEGTVWSQGILSACDVTLGEFEQMLEATWKLDDWKGGVLEYLEDLYENGTSGTSWGSMLADIIEYVNYNAMISEDELAELKKKAKAYDSLIEKQVAGGSVGGKKSSANMTAEERKARAKKAVQARIKKYGQKND